ncbi:hypothetical protein J5N97_023043 [Dioscorea zingiberensis]|uniref:Cysteine-rich receptor-like protein kinase 10 n=1 Tax=Dioscorea zingiberensis TaxID=325984 RepID=A0A9D5CBP7_9LILI|nr:hypothetical protein J5N97_023043 [Dioscorea zingiberensis]
MHCHHLLSLVSLLTLFSCIIPIAQSKVLAHVCSLDSNYTSNSTFKANLNLLLSSLSSSTPTTGYFNNTKGNAPDRVFGFALCRDDISSIQCQRCVNNTVQEITQTCSRNKKALIWYKMDDDEVSECLVRYSDENFFSSADNSVPLYSWDRGNSTEPQRFGQLVVQLMNDLTDEACNSNRFFATGSKEINSFDKIYGLVMCSRDLSNDSCKLSLRNFIASIHKLTGSREGVRLFGSSCYLRFEPYSFYNLPAVTNITPSPVSSSTGKLCCSSRQFFSSQALAFYFWRRRKPVRKTQYNGDVQEFGNAESLLLDLATLKHATNNFSEANKLGEGGFGSVYKGVLVDGQEIAVKRLSGTSAQGLIELKNEVVLVAKLQHRNLVRLLGCCLEDNEKLLVYEYLPNGSLDKFLFDPIRRVQLEWSRRYKIIEGIARGLLYLHEDSRLRIIHRDLKESNILLDEDMNPKISDFGFAKLFDVDETQGSTSRIAGTQGYMAPEYALHGAFSTKSDVYSYGVLVLEIVTGRKNFGFQASGNAPDLLGYIWQYWNEGRALELKDQSLGDVFHAEEVLRCIHIGLLCVQEEAVQRPSMATVVLALSSYSVSLAIPSPPAFYFSSSMAADFVSSSRDETLSLKTGNSNRDRRDSSLCSPNDVSISEMEAR